MNLTDQVSNRTLSQRLKELGQPQESIFVWMHHFSHDTKHISYKNGFVWKLYSRDEDDKMNETISAFTVAELGEMLPRYLQRGEYLCELQIIRSSVWRFYYGNPGEKYSLFFTAMTDDTEANARAKMAVYLAENGFIDLKGKGV